MCFIVSEPSRVAGMDIACYKALYKTKEKGKYLSSIQFYPYELGKDNPTVKINTAYRKTILEGYHSYSVPIYTKDDEGVKLAIVMCIIPKGSIFYYNPVFLEYVSSDIRLIEEIP